VRSRKKWHH